MKRPVTSPEYSADKFVNRETEINDVVDKACALTKGCPVDRRTIIFTGERGTGKSWLLAHLQAEIQVSTGAVVSLVDLRKYSSLDPTLAAANVIERLGIETEIQHEGLGVTLADTSRSLMQDIRQLLNKQVLVLLVDHVYESGWRLLAVLEDYLLGPLAVELRVLIVMAGRGRAYPWRTPELRLKAEFVDVGPFSDESITVEQLKRQQKKAVPKAPEIHDLSGGNPLANFLLAACKNPATALDQVVEEMLETVPAEQGLQVRDYLEALCVLNSFDEERIPTMLAAYYGDNSYRDWSYAQARQAREELVRWALARWDAEQGGYALDKSTRKLLERYLETARRDRWERLQRAAFELYNAWAREYPRTCERWQQEAEYHSQQLKTVRTGS